MGVYAPSMLVTPPAIQALPFGLFSVATIIEDPDVHALNGITYKSLACGADLNSFVAVCPPGSNPAKTASDADRVTVNSDDIIELYVNLSCKTTTLDEMFQEARDIFALGEERAFGEAFWTTTLVGSGATVLNASSTAADALSVTAAISALESAMACCYPGRPVFHADRGVAAYAFAGHQLQQAGNELQTRQGSPWASYACSPNTSPAGTAAPDGYAWIYATSQPVIRRWPANTAPDQVGYVLLMNADGTQTNQPYVKVERSYLPSVECCTFAVLVCLGNCS